MKKLIVILLVLKHCLSFGQNFPCVNDVSTDPNAPTNSNLPNDNLDDFEYDQLFLNRFDWIPFNQSGTLGDLQTNGLPHLGADQRMLPLYNPGLGDSEYYLYLRDELIMPENGQGGVIPNHQHGWEVLAVNLGFFPDGTPYTDIPEETNKHPRIPYVILYHRYLNKIRVFANIGDEWAQNNAYQAVRIRLGLNSSTQNYVNGIFRLQDGLDRALDQPTKVLIVGALAEAPNDVQRWFSADFTVAFDPCVCNYPSAINFDFELVKNIDLKLYGRGVTTEESIVDEAGEFVQEDFFSGFEVDFDNPEVVEGGFVMYKRMEDLFDEYIATMEEISEANDYNGQVERNLAIVKWVRHAVNVGVTVATGGSPLSIELTNKLLAHASGIVGSNITASKLSENWEVVFKEAEKILGTVINTFINDNFKKKDVPPVPEKPTANFSEMYFEGRLEQVDPKPGPTIYTPGTYGNSITEDLIDQHHYPVYNEALGVFALLKKPKIKISHHIKNAKCEESEYPVYVEEGTVPGSEVYYHEYNSEYEYVTQFKLLDDLEYFINPVLNIKDYSIDASFSISGDINNSGSLYEVINSEESVNIESTTFNVGMQENLKDLETIDFNSIYTPLDALNNFVFSMGLKRSTPIITTPEYDCAQFDEYLDQIDQDILSEENQTLIIGDVYLKLLINVTYEGEKSDGSPHEYTYMYTYKIDPDDDITYDYNNPLYPNLPESGGDITQYPENLYLKDINFDGSAVEGCILNGNTYTCKAWNDITVTGDINVASGYEVKVEAGNQTDIDPEFTPSGEITFSIVPVLDYSNPMPPLSDTAIETFCTKGNSYQANVSTKSKSMKDKEDLGIVEKPFNPRVEQTEFLFNLFPNPTTGDANVIIALEESAQANLVVTDLSGKVLVNTLSEEQLQAGNNQLILNTGVLAPGIYLVHLTVNGEKYVKRLVKQ